FFSTVEQLEAFSVWVHTFGPTPNTEPVPAPIDAQQIKHLGFLVNVVIREVGGIEEAGQYKTCKMKLDHWLNLPKKKKPVTATPKLPENKVAEAAAAKANPRPSTQPGFCSASNFTPGP